ncbi:hypothetical protein [Actinoplanes sp. NPDC051494]|uniref:hypothetical protein n=1 Tax=Actinoplanes sp. NPDC051494 TaxID=3363907 RepID=UPI0037BB5EFC
METNYTIERLLLSPSAVCAPSTTWRSESAVAALPTVTAPAFLTVPPVSPVSHVESAYATESAPVALLLAERAQVSQEQVSQAHQVQAFVSVGSSTSTGNGTTGFVGNNGVDIPMKRLTDGASGVPPRGRPV